MISRLCVRGFQSLDSIDVELGRFTVLVGPTNSGKSAIRRAIEALVHNDPATGRLRSGATYLGVQLTFEDGNVVELWKGGKKNSYVINGTEIAKPGSACPPSVRDIVQLDDVNFASQFDTPYLLAETPSAVARTLGELTNISVLFEGIREATRRSKAAAQKVKHHTDQVDVLAEKLAGYADLAQEQDQLQRIHGVLMVASETDQKARTLEAATMAAAATVDQHTAAQTQLQAEPNWEWITGTLEALEVTLGECRAWDGAVTRASQLADQWQRAKEEEAASPEAVDFTVIEEAVNRADILLDTMRRAEICIADVNTAEQFMVPTAEEIAAAEELETIDVCPLCEQPIAGHA